MIHVYKLRLDFLVIIHGEGMVLHKNIFFICVSNVCCKLIAGFKTLRA